MSRTVQTLLPYFGGNRTNAKRVGELLAGCRWVGIPFAGGMPELLHIDAPSIVVSDLHCHVINLAWAIKRFGAEMLIDHLDAEPFHPVALQSAQDRLKSSRDHMRAIVAKGCVSVEAAQDYFVTQWMGRSGQAGTDREFDGKLSVRWNANGGDSNKRYRSAVQGVAAFQSVMRRCNFVCEDVFTFLDRVQDVDGHAVYCDPPWPDAGAAYVHAVDDQRFHENLRSRLSEFRHVKVVIRYGSYELIRKLYSGDQWTIHDCEGRTQGRNSLAEVLITN